MKEVLFSMLPWIFCTALLAGPVLGQVSFTRGQKWQIILTGTPDMSKTPAPLLPPTDAEVWDIDLFDNDAATIQALKAAGKTVICYFSAGTWEDWREDQKDFPANDLGKILKEWPNEKWIRTGSTKIRDIMKKRIKIGADKGCDAIDPDNTDGYQNDNGLNLKSSDAIEYQKWLQQTAASYGMKIGLKNSLDILPAVASYMDFAVNEQCADPTHYECTAYNTFLASGKPVFHIEYPTPLTPAQANTTYCNGAGTDGMSTVLKEMSLNGVVIYCDGTREETPTKSNGNPTRPSKPPIPPRSTTRRSSTTLRPTSTTLRPSSTLISTPSSTPISTPTSTPEDSDTPSSTPTPTSTPRSSSRPTSSPRTTTRPSSSPARTSSARPTSTPGNGGGCKQKHWDQCGGQDWKGCTTCESPYQCKGVSPPYYYQCL